MIEIESAKAGKDDEFDQTHFYEHLAKQLINEKNQEATGLVVGLTGPWGSGKTQALFFIEKILEDKISTLRNKHGDKAKPLLVVKFNPWLHSGRDELLSALISNIYKVCNDKEKTYDELYPVINLFNKWKTEKKEILESVASFLNIFLKGFKNFVDDLTKMSLEQQKTELLDAFNKADASVIVLVDEIDRLTDEEICILAQVIKSVMDFKRFSYLLAYDPKRVASALGSGDEQLGHNYLEKIVQVQSRLPRVGTNSLIGFTKKMILPIFITTWTNRNSSKTEIQKLENQFKEMLQFLIPDILSTPRDIFRLQALYSLRVSVVYSEVDEFDLLRYCALETQIPLLSQELQLLAKRVSVDGGRELNRRLDKIKTREDCIKALLSHHKDNEALYDLLVSLFPALTKEGADLITQDDNQLCYETPLLTTLNYGKLPGTIERARAEEVLCDPNQFLKQLLEEANSNNLLRHAVLRLRTTAHILGSKLSENQINAFWKVFAAYFDRKFEDEDLNNWSSWLELTHVFVRGVMRGYLPKAWMKSELIYELLEEGYVHLPATFLDFHMQAHGFVNYDRDLTLDYVINEDKLKDLITEASKKFVKSIQESDEWFLRSINPIKIITYGKPFSGSFFKELSSPSNRYIFEAIMILCLRTRHESIYRVPDNKSFTVLDTEPKNLLELLDKESFMKTWRKHQGNDREARSPIAEANKYFFSAIRDKVR